MFLSVSVEISFRDFLDIQRERLGFVSWEAFAEAKGVAFGTVQRVVKENPNGPSDTRIGSRNALAVGLGFGDWFALVDAWRLRSADRSASVPAWRKMYEALSEAERAALFDELKKQAAKKRQKGT